MNKKSIYMRAGMSPAESFTAEDMLNRNIIGSNNGNLLYQYAISRTLMTEGVEVVPNRYKYREKDADIERINSECSCFIIPLADAFRADFVKELTKLTKLVDRLTIPCVVIGVGLRAPFEPNLKDGFPFDDAVRKFVKAVLNKSHMIGVRGQITADYLTTLGFIEGVDHTVIGCPSMYTFGRELVIPHKEITQASKVTYNTSITTPLPVQKFIMNNADKFKNSYYIPQVTSELRMLYTGAPSTDRQGLAYPTTIENPYCLDNRVQFFLNPNTWFDFFGDVDLSFGSRLHGNIAAILGGGQAVLIPKDSRTRELQNYHALPKLDMKDIHEDDNLLEKIENIDFCSPQKNQQRNFDHFISFLNKNGLNHIYEDDMNRKSAPLDDVLKTASILPPVESILECPHNEARRRMQEVTEESSWKTESRIARLYFKKWTNKI